VINIVLYEPEIPQNTGNIMRTCVAIGATLHLIQPFGFELSDRTLKRSGLDYIKDLKFKVYRDYKDFIKQNSGTFYFLSRYGKKSYEKIRYESPLSKIYILFGKESTGIDKKILAENLINTFRIPTTDKVRSINLSNAVAIVAFDAMRHFGFPGCFDHEPESHKGKDFLDQFQNKMSQ